MPTLLRFRFALAFLIAVLVIAAAAVAKPPTDEELAARIDALAAEALKEPGAAGLSVAVAIGDRVVLAKGYGVAELEHGVPANAETLFRIGSVTKQYTAAAVMRLVEQGKLSLDDPVEKVLPDYPAPAKTVTIRHLLNHTSGIPSYTDKREFMRRDASLELRPEEVIATFKNDPLEFDPGTKFEYNNSAYYLLGEIIGKVSGKTYAEFLRDEFFAPLGLTQTRYESNSEIIRNRAQGYRFGNGRFANDRPIGAHVPGAAGSLLATAGDLVRWKAALVEGRVVSAASYEQMATATVLPGGESTNYGFGLAVGEFHGRRMVDHGGGIFGFNSMLMHLPEEKLSVAVIANSEVLSSGRLAQRIAAAALGIEPPAPKDLTVGADEAARFTGEYKFEGIPLEIRLWEREGRIFAQATRQPETRLMYQGGGEFRASFDHSVRFVFPDAGTGPAESFVLHQGGQTITVKRKP